MQCFRSFYTAERTLEGVEAMWMMRKGLVKRLDDRDTVGQAKFIESLFSIAAWPLVQLCLRAPQSIFVTEPS